MVYSNLLFIIFFVVLIINCVSLPNLAICIIYSSIYICNISIVVLAILFMIFINYFLEGFKSSFISNSGHFYPISRGNRSLYLQKKCVCANSSNLFSDKFFPKLSFQSLLGLSPTKLIFLNLLCFCFTIKNMKAKVKKIQILSSRAIHSVAAIFLIHRMELPSKSV